MLKIIDTPQPTTRAVYVSPELAQSLLDANSANQRKVKKHRVAEYAAAMRRGEWRLSHQGIAMASDGTMIDGQHRCLAVIEAGVSVPMMVTIDLDPAVYAVVDRGAARTYTDILGISNRVTDTIAWAATLAFGEKPSPDQVQALYTTRFGATAAGLVYHCGACARVFSAAGAKTAAVCAALDGNQQFAFDAYRGLVTHQYDEMGKAAQEISRSVARGVKYRMLPLVTEGRYQTAQFYRAYHPDTADQTTRIRPATAEKIMDKMRDAILSCLEE